MVLGLDTIGTLWATRSCDCIMGWSLMEAASKHLGSFFHRLGGRGFAPTRFVAEPSWLPFSIGCGLGILAVQIHYNESRGYLGADMEEEGASSTPVALDLSTPKSWKAQGQGVVPLSF